MNEKRFASASEAWPQSCWETSSLREEKLPAGGVGMSCGVKLGSEAGEELAVAVESWMPVGSTAELVGA